MILNLKNLLAGEKERHVHKKEEESFCWTNATATLLANPLAHLSKEEFYTFARPYYLSNNLDLLEKLILKLNNDNK